MIDIDQVFMRLPYPPTPQSRLSYRKLSMTNFAWDSVIELPVINAYHRDPRITANDAGGVLIVSYSEPDAFFYPHLYANSPPENRDFDITATFYSGVPTTTEVISTTTVLNATGGPNPVIALDQEGNAHVVWSKAVANSGEIHTIRYDAQDGWEAVATILASGQGAAADPAVVAAPGGRAFATYYQSEAYNFVAYE